MRQSDPDMPSLASLASARDTDSIGAGCQPQRPGTANVVFPDGDGAAGPCGRDVHPNHTGRHGNPSAFDADRLRGAVAPQITTASLPGGTVARHPTRRHRGIRTPGPSPSPSPTARPCRRAHLDPATGVLSGTPHRGRVVLVPGPRHQHHRLRHQGLRLEIAPRRHHHSEHSRRDGGRRLLPDHHRDGNGPDHLRPRQRLRPPRRSDPGPDERRHLRNTDRLGHVHVRRHRDERHRY